MQLNDVDVGRILYTTVFARLHKYKVFVASLHLLQFLDFLQDDIVHAVLVLAEYALSLDTYFHSCFIIFAGTPATTLLSGTSLVTTAPAATTQ